jgi:hypothetical protein
MSRRVVSPPVETFGELRQPLTLGERAVFDMFNRTLPLEWEIYVQPHLNGLRPDFVLLNPQVGIGVFEVKDWNLDAMRYFVENDANKLPILMASKEGRTFSCQENNPFTKVADYKQAIYDLYCPRLEGTNGYGAITAGVIFPFASSKRVRDLFSAFLKGTKDDKLGRYQPIGGADEIQSGDIKAIFPEAGRTNSFVMSEMHAADLRGWLVEPDFARAQREPLELDGNQKTLVTTWPASRYRRIKGPAGSGKSLVLAARAAYRAGLGKSVLIVTFNITLWHYLKDLVVRAKPGRGNMNFIQFDHFHLFCKQVAHKAGLGNDYSALLHNVDWESKTTEAREEREFVLGIAIPALAKRALATGKPCKFDTIMVDEGQDYQPEWWNIMRMALAEGGEMLLVADATQDVYGTGKAWTEEAMNGMGFAGGRWAQLKTSYRTPPLAQDYTRDFAKRFLPPETADLPEVEQAALIIEPCQLHWVQCSNEECTAACVKEILLMMRETGKRGLANADITFLTDDAKVGVAVTQQLNRRKIGIIGTFGSKYRQRRREKMGFYMGHAEVKATSLHSFKGWESRMLVIHVSQSWTDENKALVYAALTRLKRSPEGSWLTVVCAAAELADYGKTWPNYHEREHGVILFHPTAAD